MDQPLFHCSTLHDRFYYDDREDFDTYIQPTSNPQQQRVRAREQPGILVIGRATLTKSGAMSI